MVRPSKALLQISIVLRRLASSAVLHWILSPLEYLFTAWIVDLSPLIVDCSIMHWEIWISSLGCLLAISFFVSSGTPWLDSMTSGVKSTSTPITHGRCRGRYPSDASPSPDSDS